MLEKYIYTVILLPIFVYNIVLARQVYSTYKLEKEFDNAVLHLSESGKLTETKLVYIKNHAENQDQIQKLFSDKNINLNHVKAYIKYVATDFTINLLWLEDPKASSSFRYLELDNRVKFLSNPKLKINKS